MTRRQMQGQRGTSISAADYALANSVLMRDRTKTQYIVLPLAAGVLARCILSTRPSDAAEPWMREMWPQWEDEARTLLDRCAADEDGEWTKDSERYGMVADFVSFAWPAFLRWTPIVWLLRTLGLPANATAAARTEAVERWLRNSANRSLVHCTILASYGFSMAARPNEPMIHARGAQRLRVILADRLRGASLTSWPQIVRAAADEWNVATLERFAGELADACDVMLVDPFTLVPEMADVDEDDGEIEALGEEAAVGLALAGTATAGTDSRNEPVSHEQALESTLGRLRDLERENSRLIEKVARLQSERDHHVDRHAGAESRAEAIRAELVDARAEIASLEFKLLLANRARDELEDQLKVDAALDAGEALSADCLAGRRILLFTGAQAADTREAMRRSFFEFGARQVDCYYVDRERGPETYPDESLVVIDVTFMPHSVSDPIMNRARASGVRCFPCRRGASLIAREVATRLRLPTRGT